MGKNEDQNEQKRVIITVSGKEMVASTANSGGGGGGECHRKLFIGKTYSSQLSNKWSERLE